MRSRHRVLWSHSNTIEIDVSPEAVFDLVADVVRTTEYSPECRHVEWTSPYDQAEVGAMFRGRNRRRPFPRWWRTARITAMERGRRFGFETVPARGPYNDATAWTYVLEATPTGTRLTECAELRGPRWIGVLDHLIRGPLVLERNIETSLQQLKRLAEQTTN